MGRPTKQGIDFFSLDCQFDDKTEMYLAEKGATGLGVLVTTWQFIYHNEGYYIINNKDLHILIKRRIGVEINEVSDCIKACIGRNIFDKFRHLKHGILTSKAIQDRYFLASRKKKIVQIRKDYVLNGVKVSNNAVYVVGNATKEKGKVKEEEKVKEEKDMSLSPLQNLWNLKCTNLSKVIENSKDRKTKEKTRLNERHFNSWELVFCMINESSFCCGENDNQWKATYDWITSNEKNAIKVLEGNYANRQGPDGTSPTDKEKTSCQKEGGTKSKRDSKFHGLDEKDYTDGAF